MNVDYSRLATFFLLVGIVLLIAFFGTDQSQNPQFCLFGLGALMTGLGAYLMAKSYKPPPPSTRFSGIKKLMARRNQPKAPKSPPGAKKKIKLFTFGKKK